MQIILNAGKVKKKFELKKANYMDERAGSGCNILNHDTEFVHIFNL